MKSDAFITRTIFKLWAEFFHILYNSAVISFFRWEYFKNIDSTLFFLLFYWSEEPDDSRIRMWAAEFFLTCIKTFDYLLTLIGRIVKNDMDASNFWNSITTMKKLQIGVQRINVISVKHGCNWTSSRNR